jgi:ribonuclease D
MSDQNDSLPELTVSEASEPVEVESIRVSEPREGLPDVVSTPEQLADLVAAISIGTGPVALDAERASGFKYSQRAYLIQLRRAGSGSHLIDPIMFENLNPLQAALNGVDWILHAASQDLVCLAEVGLIPTANVFDTELAGRLLGLPRVGLGPLIETQLGFSLAKEHSAADWSTRPLPESWLNYAALDVEFLIELWEVLEAQLRDAGKYHWAIQEFDHVKRTTGPIERIDPWRRTSGMHKIRKRNQLAVIRALWTVRNEIAQEVDISQGRLLSDTAIVEIAMVAHTKPINSKKDLERVLRPIGLRARWMENVASWISAISDALALSEDQWPQVRTDSDSLPPLKIWRERFPEKYAPLTHAKARLSAKAQELVIPLENMITPDYVRRICWNAPQGAVAQALAALGARNWQIEIAAPILEGALLETVPLALPETAEPETEPE